MSPSARNLLSSGPRTIPFQPPQGDLTILAGTANKRLGQSIADLLGVELCPCEALYFSEGNVFVRVLDNVRGRDVYVIQGVSNPVNDNFMELLFWIDALKRASAQNVTAVIPFFSYAKGDKKDEPRVSIRARVCADAIEAAGADRVLTMDLHSPQIQGFFRTPVDHLYARNVLCDYIRSRNIPDLQKAYTRGVCPRQRISGSCTRRHSMVSQADIISPSLPAAAKRLQCN